MRQTGCPASGMAGFLANSSATGPGASYVQVMQMTQSAKVKTGVIVAAPSGTAVDLLNLGPEAIHLEDIAQHLAGIARFLGAPRPWYSVADHSLLCLKLMRQRTDNDDKLRAALFHDAHKAYLGDVPGQVRGAMGETWLELVATVDGAIAEALGLESTGIDDPDMKVVNRFARSIEAYTLMPSNPDAWEDDLVDRSEIREGVTPEAIPGGTPDQVAKQFLGASAWLDVRP